MNNKCRDARIVMVGVPGISGRTLVMITVAINLSLLGYFKQAGVVVENLDAVFGPLFSLDDLVLPLAITFFAFQQIAYLVDVYIDRSINYGLLDCARSLPRVFPDQPA